MLTNLCNALTVGRAQQELLLYSRQVHRQKQHRILSNAFTRPKTEVIIYLSKFSRHSLLCMDQLSK